MTTLWRVGSVLLLTLVLGDFDWASRAEGQVTAEKPLDAKGERQPVDYLPVRPDAWRKQGIEPKLFPWEGERVVLLTTTADFDHATMTSFVQKLDAAWKVCHEATGFSPPPYRHLKGKPIIAAIPNQDLLGGSHYIVFLGMGGAEISTFYGPEGDYEQFRKSAGQLPEAYFDYMADCYQSTASACIAFSVGSRRFLQYLCREGLQHSAEEATRRRQFEFLANAYAKSEVRMAEDFTDLNQYRRFTLRDADGALMQETPMGAVMGSIVLALRNEHGGNNWSSKFYTHLSSCPRIFGIDKTSVHAQLLHFTIAVGLASQADPTSTLRDRYRFPGHPNVWQALGKIDWKKPGLTANDVIDALPSEHLLPSIVQDRPSFLTPERRQQNLLKDGSFENPESSSWTMSGWLTMNAAKGSIESGVVKEGVKAAVIRATHGDDSRHRQEIKVEPNTRYRLSGWIKTKDVVIDQQGGRYGANLSLDGGYEVTQSLVGTHDWKFVTLTFDSGPRTSVTVCARLGFFGSTCKGEAWFDDLCLIPLGPGAVRPTKPTSAPTVSNKVWKGWPKDAPAPAITPFNALQAKLHQEAWAKHLGVPVEYTNSIGMKFRLIPPGEYLRGASAEVINAAVRNSANSASYQERLRSQGPQHTVVLTQPLYLGLHEVTQGQFSAVMGPVQSHFSATGAGQAAVQGMDPTQHPADSTSWNDAAQFCTKLSQREKLTAFDFGPTAKMPQTGTGYRLPTEAEWEYACRAGTTSLFWSGETHQDMLKAGWIGDNSGKRTHAVGGARANPFGLYDQHGNVWEWVYDSYSSNAYQRFEKTSAIDPSQNDPASSQRGLRGGSWAYGSTDCWSSFRHFEPVTLRHRNVGFRVALSVEAVKASMNVPVQIESSKTRLREREGDQHRMEKRYAEAIACYRDVVQHDPNNAAILDRLAWLLAVSPLKDQPADEALQFALRACHSQTGNSSYRNTLGAAQYRAGFYAEALSNLSLVAAGPPKNFGWMPHNLLLQALCHERLGDRATAQTTYAAASALLKQPIADVVRTLEAQLLENEIAELGVLEQVRELFTLKGHSDLVLSVACSPDGKVIASGSADRTVKLWDAATGQELRTLKGDLSKITRIAFSPDSKMVAVPGLKGDQGPGDVTVWDVGTGTQKGIWKGHDNQVWALAYSPDSKQLASSSTDGTVKIWDAVKGQEIRSWKAHSSYVLWVAFSPDGKRLVTGAEGREGDDLTVWDAASGQKQFALKGHTETNGGVAFSPDGKWLVTGSSDKTLKIWDSSNGKETRTLLGHTGQVGGVVVSPDGTWIASACYDATAKIWEAATGQETRTLRGHRGGVSSVAISPDGKRLVTGSSDQAVKVWDISNIKPISAKATALATLAKSSMKPVAISGAPVSLVLHHQQHAFTSVAYSADGQRLVTAGLDPAVKVWNAITGQELQKLKPGWCAVFSPDGKRVVSGGPDRLVRVFDASSGQELRVLKGHTASVVSVAFSHDGTRLASASQDQTAKVWDASNGTELLTLKGHTGDVRCVAFSPDAKQIATSSRDQTAKLWDANNGQELQTLKGHRAEIRSVSFSPDGQWLATASHDQTVKLWTTNGRLVRTLEGHDGGVMSVAFTADGSRLVTAGCDRTSRQWDVASGRELLTLRGHNSQVVGLAISPDGQRLATASYDRTVKVWDIAAAKAPTNNYARTSDRFTRIVPAAEEQYWRDVSLTQRALTNGDFSKQLEGWQIEGSAAEFRTFNQGTETALTTAGPKIDSTTGRLYQCFKIPDDAVEMHFSLHGGADWESTYVALWQSTLLARKATARNDNAPFPVVWNVMALRGRLVTLEIVDSSTHAWGFIGVQGIKFVRQQAPSTPSEKTQSKPFAVDVSQVPLTLKGFSQHVGDIAFSADGTRIAAASHDGTVRLWDAASGNVVHTLKSTASRLAFSPDGKQLAAGGHENAVTVWDVANGTVSLRLSGLKPAILGVAFSPDGRRLAAGSNDDTLKVWDLATGQESLMIRTPAWQVAFSPDGKWLATSGHANPAAKVWDAINGQELMSLRVTQGGINNLRFSPDGKRLATAGHPSGLTVWDLATGQPTLTLEGAPFCIAFDPTGRLIATTNYSDGVVLSDAATGQRLAALKAGTVSSMALAFSADGKRLAAATEESAVKVWDLTLLPKEVKPALIPPMTTERSERPIPVVERAVSFSAETARATQATQEGPLTVSLKGHADAVTSVAISPDGKWLASGSSDGVVVWDVAGRKPRFTLRAHGRYSIPSVAVSSDGKRLAATADKFAKVWDAATGTELLSLESKTGYMHGIALSNDGQRIATSTQEHVTVWDSTSGKEIISMSEELQSYGPIAFSPDGQLLAVATKTGETIVKVWNMTRDSESSYLLGHRLYIQSLSFSPDGKRIATASDDGTVRVWATQTGDELFSVRHRHSEKPNTKTQAHQAAQAKAVALSRDGQRMVSAGSGGLVSIWNADTAQMLHAFDGHSDDVNAVAYSPDGKWVASAGNDGTLKLWTLAGAAKIESKNDQIIRPLVDSKAVAAEFKALQGTWRLTNIADFPYFKSGETPIKEAYLVIKGETSLMIVPEMDFAIPSLIRLDPMRSPKALDLQTLDHEFGPALWKGSYKLEGDTLLLIGEDERVGTRPVEFKTGKPDPDDPATMSAFKYERLKTPPTWDEPVFDLAAWQQGSQQLRRLNVIPHFSSLNSLRQRGLKLPAYVGHLDLGRAMNGGTVSADAWKLASSVTAVAFSVREPNDATLQQLTTHRGLIGLALHGHSAVTNDGFALLKNCPRFVWLSLFESSQATEVLAALPTNIDLRLLEIYATESNPKLLAAISRFPSLESLQLSDVELSDETVLELAKLTNLKTLNSHRMKKPNYDKPELGEKGLQVFEKMPQLKSVQLIGHGMDHQKLQQLNEKLRSRK